MIEPNTRLSKKNNSLYDGVHFLVARLRVFLRLFLVRRGKRGVTTARGGDVVPTTPTLPMARYKSRQPVQAMHSTQLTHAVQRMQCVQLAQDLQLRLVGGGEGLL